MKRVIKDEVFGMSNLYPKHTGLPVILWVDNVGANRKSKHNLPRLKVQNTKGDRSNEDTFTLSIDSNPKILSGKCKLNSKDLNLVKQFIVNHLDDFLLQWNQEIDEYELKDRLSQ